MGRMDKVTRVLIMYTKLLEGGKIHKKSFCAEMGIDRRTFDRDIEDIRIFLSESFMGHELVYSREGESYYLQDYQKHKTLSDMETVFLMELLKSSQILRRDEYAGLVKGILDAGERSHKRIVREIADRYLLAYQEEQDKTALLKLQWDLQQCIAEHDVVRLHLKCGGQAVFSPVSLWIYETEAYVFGYDSSFELTACPVCEIEFFRMERKKFDGELIRKFDGITWEDRETILKKARMQYGKSKSKISTRDEGWGVGQGFGGIEGEI